MDSITQSQIIIYMYVKHSTYIIICVVYTLHHLIIVIVLVWSPVTSSLVYFTPFLNI